MRRKSHHLIDLTPMIDILFTVLLFFLLTQNIPVNSFNLAIPESQQKDGSQNAPNTTTLHIFPQNKIFALNSTKFTETKALKQHLQALEKSTPITIVVDSTSPSSNLVIAMEILNELKFSQVSIVTKND